MSLVQGPDGNLYGTTTGGGANSRGIVFKISPKGDDLLYSFCSPPNCSDGRVPLAGLVLAADDNFYGSTSSGGTYGWGTIFTITRNGALSTLYSFCAQPSCSDGTVPEASLVEGNDGSFYGSTAGGGIDRNGTVFKISPGGVLKTLHRFKGTDGSNPEAVLVQGTDGNFYGTTAFGGADGSGTIFKITPDGHLNYIAQLCRLRRVRWLVACSWHRREFVWDDQRGRCFKGRHGLQNYLRRRTDDALRILQS
jgi:uncharacterized repeat protein (TIGR03803 family)